MTLREVSTLSGHAIWVTSIVTCPDDPNMIMSTSRDATCIVWKLQESLWRSHQTLKGHRDVVSSGALSKCGNFALTGSWDKTLLLWDISTGEDVREFCGHTQDVNAVAFSEDNRQIFSGSRDRTIKLWNTLAECKYTMFDTHRDWISDISLVPGGKLQLISASLDRTLRITEIKDMRPKPALHGHTRPVNTCTVSPDGSLCASGGMDRQVILWVIDSGEPSQFLASSSAIYAVAFNPTRYWLAAGTADSIMLWDLGDEKLLTRTHSSAHKSAQEHGVPLYVSLCWSQDGNSLFVGSSDGNIYVYEVISETSETAVPTPMAKPVPTDHRAPPTDPTDDWASPGSVCDW